MTRDTRCGEWRTVLSGDGLRVDLSTPSHGVLVLAVVGACTVAAHGGSRAHGPDLPAGAVLSVRVQTGPVPGGGHPLARRAIAGGDGVVDDRLAEEKEAKEVLSGLEEMDPDSADFEALLETLRVSVLAHAHHEEHYEFRYLRQHYGTDRLRTLAATVRAAEKTAPTHPHPGTETATANLAAGPILALFDRAKDTIRKAMSNEG